MIHKSIFFLPFVLLFLSSCNSDRLDVDASDIKINISFLNMDSLLFVTKDSTKFLGVHKQWEKQVPELYEYQLYCFNIRKLDAASNFRNYRRLLDGKYAGASASNNYMVDLENALHSKFTKNDLTNRKSIIRSGFQHLKYHLPKAKAPLYITFNNSLFTTAVFCGEKNISIGLEWYLGGEHPLVKEVPSQKVDSWMKERMHAEYLERDVLYGWILTNILPDVEGSMAQYIVHYGKALYLTEASFPKAAKRIILRYTQKDFDWALKNEEAFWNYLIQQKLLLTKKELDIANMINDGPFTPGIPEDGAPDRLGQFLGWRMVKQYMDTHEEVSLQDLVTLDYNTILQAFEIKE